VVDLPFSSVLVLETRLCCTKIKMQEMKILERGEEISFSSYSSAELIICSYDTIMNDDTTPFQQQWTMTEKATTIL
jgi:hypothetical protein